VDKLLEKSVNIQIDSCPQLVNRKPADRKTDKPQAKSEKN
jgi:hypothetical protein